MSMSHRFDQL
jgi:hypothetical protein